jgi:hypothetical protein
MSVLCEINAGRLGWGIRQRGRRERERDCGMGREGENGDEERKRRGFLRGQHWLILTNGLNQHMGIFGYGK